MNPNYEVRESPRARALRITVYPSGKVVVTKPTRVSTRVLEAFVQERTDWIETTLTQALKRRGGLSHIELPNPRKGSRAYLDAIADARALAHERLQHFNTLYKTSYGSISIRNQKTRWGSCTAKNNLSFNYKIAFLPAHLSDYIIVHELCHTIEHNHSDRFWAQVERAVPKHKEIRTELRTRYEI